MKLISCNAVLNTFVRMFHFIAAADGEDSAAF